MVGRTIYVEFPTKSGRKEFYLCNIEKFDVEKGHLVTVEKTKKQAWYRLSTVTFKFTPEGKVYLGSATQQPREAKVFTPVLFAVRLDPRAQDLFKHAGGTFVLLSVKNNDMLHLSSSISNPALDSGQLARALSRSCRRARFDLRAGHLDQSRSRSEAPSDRSQPVVCFALGFAVCGRTRV